MTKKTKSEKQVFCLENMPIIKSKKNSVSFAHNPSPFFRSHEKVATAFLQNLEEYSGHRKSEQIFETDFS